ncbi:LysR family transcriptional regulator [Pseudomonas putida]|jgi:DNA-binding transcriptional LysR family regulator|uniref:LysR family transcriptional regulator n=1 Tax=Pseudomonas putida TaxID=303 RepID=UPI00062B09A7|nr:LysR family transcriptional regulator [Pseudomonas putida]KKX68450.1 LysR family transcriptional regulator [Pseudomonas putida]
MRRIDFVSLRLFVAVAEELSLTRAGVKEHLSLAAVSKRISDLESHIGCALLYRQHKGVALTPAGQSLLHHARNLMANVEQMHADLSEFSSGVKGHVRIQANASATIEYLPDSLSTFTQAFPEVKIDLEERPSAEIVRSVRDGTTDIGIYAGHLDAHDLEVFSYRRDSLVLVTRKDHPLAKQTTVRMADTLDYEHICFQQDTALHARLQNTAIDLDRSLRIRIQLRSFEAICRMIHAGMGIGILPHHAIRNHLPAMDLVTVDFDEPWAARELRLCVRSYDALSVIARQMVDHLLAESRSTSG